MQSDTQMKVNPSIGLFYVLALKDNYTYDKIKSECLIRSDFQYMSGIKYYNAWGYLFKLLETIR